MGVSEGKDSLIISKDFQLPANIPWSGLVHGALSWCWGWL